MEQSARNILVLMGKSELSGRPQAKGPKGGEPEDGDGRKDGQRAKGEGTRSERKRLLAAISMTQCATVIEWSGLGGGAGSGSA